MDLCPVEDFIKRETVEIKTCFSLLCVFGVFFPGCKYVNLEERRGALLHFDPWYPEFTTIAVNKP